MIGSQSLSSSPFAQPDHPSCLKRAWFQFSAHPSTSDFEFSFQCSTSGQTPDLHPPFLFLPARAPLPPSIIPTSCPPVLFILFAPKAFDAYCHLDGQSTAASCSLLNTLPNVSLLGNSPRRLACTANILTNLSAPL